MVPVLLNSCLYYDDPSILISGFGGLTTFLLIRLIIQPTHPKAVLLGPIIPGCQWACYIPVNNRLLWFHRSLPISRCISGPTIHGCQSVLGKRGTPNWSSIHAITPRSETDPDPDAVELAIGLHLSSPCGCALLSIRPAPGEVQPPERYMWCLLFHQCLLCCHVDCALIDRLLPLLPVTGSNGTSSRTETPTFASTPAYTPVSPMLEQHLQVH